jgi:phosphatidylserine/phosphatidylglycerophosphate/cardiolipin synthase-like enzyme
MSWGCGVIDIAYGVNHHKFMVFDEEVAWIGSANFSDSAFSGNDENAVVIHDKQVAYQYAAFVKQCWQKIAEYDSSLTAPPIIMVSHFSGT